MIKEHDCVVLTAHVPDDGLMAGDVGTVVHIHKGGEGYEVEFAAGTCLHYGVRHEYKCA